MKTITFLISLVKKPKRMPWLCRIGLHRWKYDLEAVNIERECKRCHRQAFFSRRFGKWIPRNFF